MAFDIIFLGHFAIDEIIYDQKVSHSLGGGVTYGSLAAHNYNSSLKLGITSKVGRDFDDDFLGMFKDGTIDLNGIKNDSEKSTRYRLQYHGKTRDLTLQGRANTIQYEDVPEEYKGALSFMISPIANEINKDLIDSIIEDTSAYIAADVQGFIRKFRDDGTIIRKRDEEMAEKVRNIIEKCNGRLILKASDDEANYIADRDDVIESTQYLSELSNAVVLTTLGPDGSLIKYKDYKMIHVPALVPKQLVDETGAGDCYTAVFLSEFLKSDKDWADIKKAGYCASTACSFLIENQGPQGYGSYKQVQERLKNKKAIETPFHEKVKENDY